MSRTEREQRQSPASRTARWALALAAGALLGAGAQAQTTALSTASGPGLYIGGSLGAPRYQDGIGGGSTGGDGVSVKGYLGYQFSPYVSVEGTLADLGHVDGGTGRVKSRAASVDLVGTLPLNTQFSLLGRIGAAQVRSTTPAGKDDGTGLKLGLGAEYALSRNVALRGEWERYRADLFGNKPDIDQYTVGVKYKF